MKEKFKNPFVIVALVSSLLMLLGALLGWVNLNETAKVANDLEVSLGGEDIKSYMSERTTVVAILGGISVLVTAVTAWFRLRFLQIIVVLISLFAAAIAYNQLPESIPSQVPGASFLPGFWLSLIFGTVLVISSIGIIITVRKQKNMAEPTYQASTPPTLVNTPIAQAPQTAVPTPSQQSPPDSINPPNPKPQA